MAENSKRFLVGFKVSEAEYDLLTEEAKKRKLSKGQAARSVLLEALSGYDQKQEYLMRRLDMLNEKIEERFALLLDIASLGAAAGALPLDAEQHDPEALRLRLKTHFKHSNGLGKNLVDMLKSGKLEI
jgi:hypothetical protein